MDMAFPEMCDAAPNKQGEAGKQKAVDGKLGFPPSQARFPRPKFGSVSREHLPRFGHELLGSCARQNHGPTETAIRSSYGTELAQAAAKRNINPATEVRGRQSTKRPSRVVQIRTKMDLSANPLFIWI